MKITSKPWRYLPVNLQISSISAGLGGGLSLTPPSLRHNTSPFGLLLLATLSAINLNLTPHLHHPLLRSIQSYLNSLAFSRVHTTMMNVKGFGSIEGVFFKAIWIDCFTAQRQSWVLIDLRWFTDKFFLFVWCSSNRLEFGPAPRIWHPT